MKAYKQKVPTDKWLYDYRNQTDAVFYTARKTRLSAIAVISYVGGSYIIVVLSYFSRKKILNANK